MGTHESDARLAERYVTDPNLWNADFLRQNDPERESRIADILFREGIIPSTPEALRDFRLLNPSAHQAFLEDEIARRLNTLSVGLEEGHKPLLIAGDFFRTYDEKGVKPGFKRKPLSAENVGVAYVTAKAETTYLPPSSMNLILDELGGVWHALRNLLLLEQNLLSESQSLEEALDRLDQLLANYSQLLKDGGVLLLDDDPMGIQRPAAHSTMGLADILRSSAIREFDFKKLYEHHGFISEGLAKGTREAYLILRKGKARETEKTHTPTSTTDGLLPREVSSPEGVPRTIASEVTDRRLFIHNAVLALLAPIVSRYVRWPDQESRTVRVPPLMMTYTVKLGAEERAELAEWRTEIETKRRQLETGFTTGIQDTATTEARMIIGDRPNPEDITLYSIGRFFTAKGRWHTFPVLHNVLMKGEGTMADLDRETHNCIVGCVAIDEITKSYGIPGSITNPIGYNGHMHWKQAGGRGRILDPYWCAHRHGFVENEGAWRDTVLNELVARGMDTSRKNQLKAFSAIIR